MYLELLLILLVSALGNANSAGKTIIKHAYIGACSNPKRVATQISNVKPFIKDNWGYFDLDANITKDFGQQLQLTLTIQKCGNLESPDSCVQFLKPTLTNFCRIMFLRNQIWTPLIECVTPKPECPMKKGIYYLRNCTVDIDSVRFIPNGYGSFKTNIEIKNVGHPESLICCNIEMSGLKK